MTHTFDCLMTLYGAIFKGGVVEYQPLVILILREAAKQLDTVDPESVNFEKYAKDRPWRMEGAEEERLCNYIDFCHDALDHTDEYHGKCFKRPFLKAITLTHNIIKYDIYDKKNPVEHWIIDVKSELDLIYPHIEIVTEILKLEGKKYRHIDGPLTRRVSKIRTTLKEAADR